MPSRLEKLKRHSRSISTSDRFAIHQDSNKTTALVSAAPKEPHLLRKKSGRSLFSSSSSSPINQKSRASPNERSVSRPSLEPVADGAINSVLGGMARGSGATLHGNSKPLPASAAPPSRMNSTIRPVRSFEFEHRLSEDSITDSAGTGTSARAPNTVSPLSSSVNSNASKTSVESQSPRQRLLQEQQRTQYKQHAMDRSTPPLSLEVPRSGWPRAAGEAGRSSFEIPQRDSSLTATAVSKAAETHTPHAEPQPAHDVSLSATEAQLSGNWDNSIGKAGLGKTGRVINKLVSDNEALKRDIQIERLRAEESKQAARLLEDKMERIISDYESRLLEANVTKTLLARKERQVESLQATIELEKKRAAAAVDRERTWKDELEKGSTEAKRQVDEAGNRAALMEGRYNAISSHWREQGDEVNRAMGKMGGEITRLLEERRKDDDRINTLRELCDQQDGNIRDLRHQKESISDQFAHYKAQQEDMLRDIKTKAQHREEEQERMLLETREVLDKLKWALNVKGNIDWAE